MIQIAFEKERDTKNTVRFAEVVKEGDEAVVGTIYINKERVAEQLDNGDTLTVTIETA